ncbi:restriction endonuclease subunit S [Yimella sp. cx-573]|nr:restriction endonuclease subunit S [Yimella sp. cx-573]
MTWPVRLLGEVSDTALGKMLDRGRPKGLPHVQYLRNVNVQWGRIDTDDLLTMELSDQDRERFGVLPGDLLVCEGGEIGRCAIWRGRDTYLAYQKALHRVRPSDALDAAYLRYLLEHHAHTGVLSRLATGSTIAHLPQQQLRRVPVPLPTPGVQRHVIEILEGHLSHLDAAASYASAAIERGLEDLRASTWKRAFADSAHSPVPLASVATIANGQTPKGLADRLVAEPSASTVPFYKVGDMNAGDGRYMSTARTHIDRGTAKSLGLHIRDGGTVLIPKRGGAIATNKKRVLRAPAAYDLNTMGLVPSPGLNPLYLWHWLQGIDLGKLADGSQVPQINGPQIRGLAIPLPAHDVQTEIVAGLELELEARTRLAAATTTALRRNDTLRRAVLAAAFSGKLTGHHTDDEAIEELAEATA